MAYTYLDIVNEVLKSLNEIELTSVTFSSASGFHSFVKDAVNKSILDAYVEKNAEWPFFWQAQNFDTVIGQQLYTKPTSVSKLDWDSFYIAKNALVTPVISATFLDYVSLDVYRKSERFLDDKNASSSGYEKPTSVIRTQNNNILLSGVPDKVYNVNYEGYTKPVDLALPTDVPAIPEEGRSMLVDRAKMYAVNFRDNVEQGQIERDLFKKNLHDLARIFIPNQPYARY